MFEYRVTKYDPRKRNSEGHYLADEWTFYAQVGTLIAGSVLTMEEYLQTENVYINTAIGMLRECGVEALNIEDLENHLNHQEHPFPLIEGASISTDSLDEVLRSLLREKFWCRLEGEGEAYIHVGWDYYLYVGIPCTATASIKVAQSAGLFVESFISPYKLQKSHD